jgi:IclR family transcriptional regulator, pca regulon regulatory protein
MKLRSEYGTISNKDAGNWVTSLSRGLQILECFTSTRPRLSQSDVQVLTGAPKSTVFRLLRTLVGLSYLKYDPEAKKYYLGPKVLSLGFTVLQSLEAREIARPYLERLAREFKRSVHLTMPDKGEIVLVDKIKVPGLRDFSIGIGSRVPIYNTACGKAVLAFLSPENLRKVLGQVRQDSATARFIGSKGQKLASSLAEVRKQGYAIDDQEVTRGIRVIAVPVFSSEGTTFALEVVVPPEEVSISELRRNYAPRLISVSKELSEALGYRGPEV